MGSLGLWYVAVKFIFTRLADGLISAAAVRGHTSVGELMHELLA